MYKSNQKSYTIKKRKLPRVLFSAMRGSSGKTIVTLCVIRALISKGLKIQPFKKGPDYIDAAYLTKAAEQTCRHLDLYLMDKYGVKETFFNHASEDVYSVIEGNRGLFDGVDIYGTYSTAKIATLLKIPVILIIDCTKITNTAASLVLGCKAYDNKTPLQGVILNNVAGKRHGDIISQSIEYHSGLPVLGSLPKIDVSLPERHLGLTTVNEIEDFEKKLNVLKQAADKYFDLDKIIDIAERAQSLKQERIKTKTKKNNIKKEKVKIGIIRDKAFQFYYPDNLEALINEGAEITEFNSMTDKEIKDIDLLYIAGGFPEVHANKISKNISFRKSIKNLADQGLPIYGECGAVMYLGNQVMYENKKYNMCGVFPLDFELQIKPAGHGYSDLEVDQINPFFSKGLKFKGHEFHYSKPINWHDSKIKTAFLVHKGHGMDGKRDGIIMNNVFATYMHLHASSTHEWARGLIKVAITKKNKNQ